MAKLLNKSRIDTPRTAAVWDYRATVAQWVNLSALVMLPPFAIYHFIHGQYLMASAILVVIAIFTLYAVYHFRGLYLPPLIVFGVVPILFVVLATSLEKQGIIGALWCYPTVLAFHFALPSRYALIASIGLLVVVFPQVWLLLQPDLAVRVTVTLILVTTFSAIFVHVITNQQLQLQREQALQRENMANVSHELRTPLATLMAQVDAMHDDIRPLNKEQLSTVSRSIDHLSHLVDDLHQLALADVSALVYRDIPEHLDDIVEQAVVAAQDKLAQRQLSVVTRIHKPTVVDGEEKLLRQIIDNLLENCYRYCNSGGEIHIVLEKHGLECTLTVEDNGPGVDAKVLPSLFERFYRVDTSRARDKGGVGLGLALVKAFTEAHGGRVRAYPSQQGGLGMRISLPLTTSP